MQFEELLLIPSHLPPHKEASDLASGKDRLEMLALAVEDIPEAGVCDIELHKSGKSYTIETVSYTHLSSMWGPRTPKAASFSRGPFQ